MAILASFIQRVMLFLILIENQYVFPGIHNMISFVKLSLRLPDSYKLMHKSFHKGNQPSLHLDFYISYLIERQLHFACLYSNIVNCFVNLK